ncbi:uncharacterized protein TrAFT101_000752 [Trichoderma asperellum]|uniref:DUF3669 domain-containing protein n=1 Tax=Trichoderma asperellum (strain ATCC 204424 / CBS 433.97 / NBRC 101777) TaxID=1042311 RepID=A0A2T3ZKJ1_TRIA4|nr:hypothetical protein M441DRAFT_76409 [Trichoderma asperellum CBS 433.97]PTB45293.1 hypothetical protein M441DRAFT_76409 [Trichoderma asperellum CBS 433.97]UKZ84861.1 hypothetical protein TrAFT101_000752 [Trichoderma asperellum]
MDRIREIVFTQVDKRPKAKKTTLVSRCLCSSIAAFWAHAQMLAQTDKSWIYVANMPPFRVTKLSRNTKGLFREYKIHKKVDTIFKAMSKELIICGLDIDLPFVPECSNFYPNISSSPCSETLKHLNGFPTDASGYFMEYIRPLNEHHTKYLIKRYLTRSAQCQALSTGQSKHFLAKVYLGDTKPLSDPWNTNMHDRPAYLDHLLAERVEVSYLAASMGATLAILHWSCGVDARGVEFVLGRDARGHVQFWLIDFADCAAFPKTPEAVTTQLVDAVMDNEPFWPRFINIQALRELWAHFRDAYLAISDFIMTDAMIAYDNDAVRALPCLFMMELEKIRGSGQLLA